MTPILIFTVCVLLYMVPTIVASRRDHRNAPAIAVLNIFLGWTFVFWVIALVWASMEPRK